MIYANQVTKILGNTSVIRDFSCTLTHACITGLLGANGAGKTTIMRMLSGYLPPTTGQILIAGHDLFLEPKQARKIVGYLPETAPLYLDMRVREYLEYVADLKLADDRLSLDAIAQDCGIAEVKHQKIATLSRGYRQRVGLAQALIGNPPVLIIDEPTSAQDPLQIQQIRRLLKELARMKTILISTHILSEVEQICDRVLILHQGAIAADGSLASLLADGRSLEQVYLQATHSERVV